MDYKNTIIEAAIKSFERRNNQLTQFINSLPENRLYDEVAAGRNTGIYLVGHIIAVNETMLPLFNLGEKLFPELDDPFVKKPDNPLEHGFSQQEMIEIWKVHSIHLLQRLSSLSTEKWFEKHGAVSEQQFILEPHRNKLNILINRTNHFSYHLGQFTLLQ